jgi:hypothetical protein
MLNPLNRSGITFYKTSGTIEGDCSLLLAIRSMEIASPLVHSDEFLIRPFSTGNKPGYHSRKKRKPENTDYLTLNS